MYNIWFYSPFGLILNSLKIDSALRRTLMASVLRSSMSMVTLVVTLVVSRLLSGSPLNVMLKINTSEKKPFTSYFYKNIEG